MKQYQINKAYPIISKLSSMQFPVKTARAIYMLMRQLEPAYKFELEHERKLVEKYGGTIEPNGTVLIRDKEKASKFRQEIEELGDLDYTEEFDVVTIDCCVMDDMTMSPYEMMILDGFVEFV